MDSQICYVELMIFVKYVIFLRTNASLTLNRHRTSQQFELLEIFISPFSDASEVSDPCSYLKPIGQTFYGGFLLSGFYLLTKHLSRNAPRRWGKILSDWDSQTTQEKRVSNSYPSSHALPREDVTAMDYVPRKISVYRQPIIALSVLFIVFQFTDQSFLCGSKYFHVLSQSKSYWLRPDWDLKSHSLYWGRNFSIDLRCIVWATVAHRLSYMKMHALSRVH